MFPLPSFWWLLTILGIPRIVDASLQSLPPSSPCLLLCVPLCLRSLSAFLLQGHLSLALEATLNPRWSHLEILNLIISPPTLLPNKGTFAASGGLDLEVSFHWLPFNPLHCPCHTRNFCSTSCGAERWQQLQPLLSYPCGLLTLCPHLCKKDLY